MHTQRQRCVGVLIAALVPLILPITANAASWKTGLLWEHGGSTANRLLGVSCFSTSSCAAVGFLATSLGDLPLALQWNGATWTSATVPVPKEKPVTELFGASCPSSTECFAVGGAENGFATQITLVEQLKSKEWKIVPSPNPAKAAASILKGVSCVSSTVCIAVGDYANEVLTNENLAEIWNGTEWKIQATPNEKEATFDELVAVSCTSSSKCTAVGNYRNKAGNTHSLAERYNGKEWLIQETPNPTGATNTELLGVSCVSSTECYTVGHSEDGGGTLLTLGELWNGTKWALQKTPNPSGSKGATLSGVSCRRASECEASGSYTNSSGKVVTLAEGWGGKEWAVQATQELNASPYELFGVSCGATAKCQAVGDAVSTAPKELVLIEEYG